MCNAFNINCFSSYVDGNDYYACYQILDNGGIKLIKFNSNLVTIYETLQEDELAHADIHTNGFGNTLGIDLYVPTNTIQIAYNFQ